jgi:metallo-beta-lactamase class B
MHALAAAAAALGTASYAQTPPPSQETISFHVTAAERLAGDDLRALLVLCKPAPAARPPQAMVDKFIAAQIGRAAPEPGKAFDNLYFVGGAWASAWALQGSEGVILIDALNNGAEAERLIDGGMKKLGLDPAQIRLVLVTHAHGDHYGGLEHLARYRPGVAMSGIDWQQAEGKLEFDSPHWGRPPKFDAARDRKLDDGERLALGDVGLTAYVTPGHTLGTVTPVFEAKSGGRTHKVLLWGGTAFNFGKDIPRLEGYIAATERMARLAREQGIDAMISNHAGYDGSVEKLAALRRGPAANPFVIGTDAVVRSLNVMGACARAQRDRFLLDK